MPTFRVTNKTTGSTVYAYGADAAVEFPEYPFALFAHTEVVPLSDGTVSASGRYVSKIEFRRRFPDSARPFIDEFNATFEVNVNLTAEHKRAIRSGLEDYRNTPEVNLDDASVVGMLGLYVALGLLTEADAEAVRA